MEIYSEMNTNICFINEQKLIYVKYIEKKYMLNKYLNLTESFVYFSWIYQYFKNKDVKYAH